MTDTAELIARLTSTPEKHEARMVLWDRARALVRDGDTSSGPRDIIESVIDGLEEDAQEAADALSSLVRERDKARAEVARLERELDDADEDACELENDYALERSRATAAEAELTRLRAENEKMREALEPSAATKAAYIGEFMIAVERWPRSARRSRRSSSRRRKKAKSPWTLRCTGCLQNF